MSYPYDSPRVSYGRRNAIAPIPYGSVRESVGPTGATTSLSARNLPITQPGLDDDLPSDRRLELKNHGNISRGPSPQSRLALSGSSPMPMNNPGPAPTPFAGNAGGLGYSGAAPATPAPAGLTTDQKKMLKGYRDRLHAEAKAIPIGLDGLPTPEAKAKMDEVAKYDEQLNPRPTFLDPKPAASAASPVQTAPSPSMPNSNPQTGSPQMNAPISPAPLPSGFSNGTDGRIVVDRSDPGLQSRERQMYATAATDLDKNPQLGTTAPQHTPLPPLTPPPSGMGNGPADYRQASATAYRNQASIARVNQAGDDKVNNANQAQVAQNQQASVNIGNKGAQMDLARAATTQPAQPAQAAAPTSQPAQVASAQPSQAQPTAYDPKTGHRIAFNGTAWVDANTGQPVQ